jgi:hypothetical protein
MKPAVKGAGSFKSSLSRGDSFKFFNIALLCGLHSELRPKGAAWMPL